MPLSDEELQKLKNIALEVRRDIVKMIGAAGSGHPGGSLSIVEILVALYFHVMKVFPDNPKSEERDLFHLSKGHACPALYSVLARKGFFDISELMTLRKLGSKLQGHPHRETKGIEMPSGSLGQGLSIACGMAAAAKLDGKTSRVFTLLGDGELQEGQVWEAANFASHYKLDNLFVIVDRNGLQIDGAVKEIMNVGPLAKKWESFGFEVRIINGHDFNAIIDSLESLAGVKGEPHVIIANTVKGKGISFMENNLGFHGKAPTPEEVEKGLKELGENG